MRILVSGASGFIGKRLVDFLRGENHAVFRLVRAQGCDKRVVASDCLTWDPENGQVSPHGFEGFDAIVHLAGKNPAERRWTKKVKKELFQSRCRDTWLLAQALSRTKKPPSIFITASAVGYYGNRGEEILDENAKKGEGFLADLCDHWERATEVFKDFPQTRVIHARFGAVLAPQGGLLSKISPLFKGGLGTVLGSGQQWMSWIGLEDLVRAIHHILVSPSLEGPVNLCTEIPARNEEFCQLLAGLYHRKCHLKVPGFVLKIALGEIADEMLLSSTRAFPAKLKASGFAYRYPTLPQLFQAIGCS